MGEPYHCLCCFSSRRAPHTRLLVTRRRLREVTLLGDDSVPCSLTPILSLSSIATSFDQILSSHLKKLKESFVPTCLNLVNDLGYDGISAMCWWVSQSRPSRRACRLDCLPAGQTPPLALLQCPYIFLMHEVAPYDTHVLEAPLGLTLLLASFS